MGKLQKNESGFSVVEIVLVIVVVALIGVVGYMVYHNHHKTTTAADITTTSSTKPASKTSTKTTTTPSQPVNPYAGWESYCSSVSGDFCVKYPTTWTFAKSAGEGGPDNWTITSPSGSVIVVYTSCGYDDGPLWGVGPFSITSVTPLPSDSSYSAVEAIQTSRNAAAYYVSPNSELQSEGVKTGATLNSVSGQWTGTDCTDTPPAQSNLVLEHYDSVDGDSPYIASSQSAAEAWFTSSEVQTGGQILNSLSPSN